MSDQADRRSPQAPPAVAGKPPGWGARLLAALRRPRHLGGRPAAAASAAGGRSARFRLLYERFREILALNDSTLQLIADIEERLEAPTPFALETMVARVRRAAMDVFVMAKDLNQIAAGKHHELYAVLRALNNALEAEIAEHKLGGVGPMVLPLRGLRATDALLVGAKMANLAEVGAVVGLLVPDGFVVTTSAFARLMEAGELWEKAGRLEGILESGGPGALAAATAEVQSAITGTALPEEVAEAIESAFDELAASSEPAASSELRVAMRSSAVGEDAAASHAGQYRTELEVPRAGLQAAYLRVVASAFSTDAVTYRFLQGLTAWEAAMAVGCLRMVAPRFAGIMFSRPFDEPAADRVVLSVTSGLGAALASGNESGEELVIEREPSSGPSAGPPAGGGSSWRVRLLGGAEDEPWTLREGLADGDLTCLVEAGRRLESHFAGPQDVEWALDGERRLFILQTRPMVPPAPVAAASHPPIGPPGDACSDARQLLLHGGRCACRGIAAGSVFQVRSDSDLDRLPEGAVLVARHSSPSFSRAMPRCAAIVTDVGSSTGHMAILAREMGVPAIVGIGQATATLAEGRPVTVDASNCRVYDGGLLTPPPSSTAERSAEAAGATSSTAADGMSAITVADDTPIAADNRASTTAIAAGRGGRASGRRSGDHPALRSLRRLSGLVTPLSLTDPGSPLFRAESCRSLHDITRFVHEKVFEVMFHYGDMAMADRQSSLRLEARLPIVVLVFDVGGGLAEEAAGGRTVRVEQVRSLPLCGFLEGLLDPRIRWDQPRPVSGRGLLSVFGESMLGPPAKVQRVGQPSYVVASDRYMNFSTKAGYHFSTVDTNCDASPNRNYIHFRFAGGGAAGERRWRRIRFLSRVLSALDFEVRVQPNDLVARLQKYDRDTTRRRLVDLGRLTLCARQLDMLMDDENSPDFFAQIFLAGEMERF